MMTRQCRVTHCNKCTPLVLDVDNGEVAHVCGQAACGKSVYLPLSCAQFLYLPQPKTSLKKNRLKKKEKNNIKVRQMVLSCASPNVFQERLHQSYLGGLLTRQTSKSQPGY